MIGESTYNWISFKFSTSECHEKGWKIVSLRELAAAMSAKAKARVLKDEVPTESRRETPIVLGVVSARPARRWRAYIRRGSCRAAP